MAVERHLLTGKEKALMHVLLNMAEKNDEGVCLVRPLDILTALPYDYDFTPDELEPMLKGLELDDYLDFIPADRHGESVYCVTMHKKGLAFARVERAWHRSLLNKVLITALTAMVSGTIWLIVHYVIAPLVTGRLG